MTLNFPLSVGYGNCSSRETFLFYKTMLISISMIFSWEIEKKKKK